MSLKVLFYTVIKNIKAFVSLRFCGELVMIKTARLPPV
jgi:hypothetical protein